MAKAKPDLAKLLTSSDDETAPPVAPAKPITRGKGVTTRQKEGQVSIQGWYPNAVKFTLEELRLKRSKELGRKVTSQELMGEALNELFKKYGFAEVAPTKD